MYKEVVISFQGKEKKVLAERIDKKIWFKINDQIFSQDIFDLTSRHDKKNRGSKSSNDKILAPMPGKVTKIFVIPGQKVQKGQTLLVMEAMKMEYTLKSDIDATVEKLNAQVNQQVNLGHLLVQLSTEAKA